MSSASPDHGGSRASYTSPESGDASKGDSSQPSLEFLRSLAEKRNVRGKLSSVSNACDIPTAVSGADDG
jgi:hypothetical protein